MELGPSVLTFPMGATLRAMLCEPVGAQILENNAYPSSRETGDSVSVVGLVEILWGICLFNGIPEPAVFGKWRGLDTKDHVNVPACAGDKPNNRPCSHHVSP